MLMKKPRVALAPITYGSHATSSMITPTDASGMLWPGIMFDEPSRLYFPLRAPTTAATASALMPAAR